MNNRLVMTCCLLAPLCCVPTAGANDNGEAIEFRAPPKARFQVGESLWFGADVVIAMEYSENLDLHAGRDDHLLLAEPEIRGVFVYQPSPVLSVYTELQLDGQVFLDKGKDNDRKSEGHVRVEQLFFDWSGFADDMNIVLGRQDYEDPRAWWYDEKIDAAQVRWEGDGWFASAGAGREKAFADDFAHDDTDEKVDFIILNGGYRKSKREQTTLFLVKKDNRESGRDEDLTYVGFQRIGKVDSDLRYWLDAALLRGHYRGRRVKAHAFDSGFALRFDSPWEPFVTLALAYGSGDNDRGDGVDGNFRQTGLQDNEARTFGTTSYKYYGEVTDFELGNLWVGTLGIGIRPDDNFSVEIAHHRYRQDDAEDDLIDSDLEIDPTGDAKSLGHETDLVLAYRPSSDIKLSLTFGYFQPGRGFGDDRDSAWFGQAKVGYRF